MKRSINVCVTYPRLYYIVITSPKIIIIIMWFTVYSKSLMAPQEPYPTWNKCLFYSFNSHQAICLYMFRGEYLFFLRLGSLCLSLPLFFEGPDILKFSKGVTSECFP